MIIIHGSNVTWCQKWDHRMVSLCKPPNPLSFMGNVAQNWRDFEEQLKWYLAGMEASKKSDIGIMLSHAGKEARNVYKTLEWTAEGDQSKFNKVLEAFQRYCSPHKNIIYERYRFWTIQQEYDETIDAYLTRIRMKIDLCEYDKEGWPSGVRQELIRDKFVFGLTDDSLKERLLHEVDVSLAKAVETAQRAKSSKKQIREMIKPSVNIMQASEQSRKQQQTQSIQAPNANDSISREIAQYLVESVHFVKSHHFANICWSKQALMKSKQTKESLYRRPQADNNETKPKEIVHKVEEQHGTMESHCGQKSNFVYVYTK